VAGPRHRAVAEGRGQRKTNTGTLAAVGRITLNQKPVRADQATARIYPYGIGVRVRPM